MRCCQDGHESTFTLNDKIQVTYTVENVTCRPSAGARHKEKCFLRLWYLLELSARKQQNKCVQNNRWRDLAIITIMSYNGCQYQTQLVSISCKK